ncbi:MAG: diguanylate cyclase [Anaerolineaceae bacterium]
MRIQLPNEVNNKILQDPIANTPGIDAESLDSLLLECMEYFIRSDYQLALPFTLKLLDAYQKNQEPEQVMNGFFLLMMIYEQAGNFPTTIEVLPYVIENLSKLPPSEAIVKTHAALGRLYFLLEDYDQATTYLLKSLEIQKSLNSTNNLAMIYKYLADAFGAKQEIDQAIDFAQESLKHCSSKTQPFLQASCLNSLGAVYQLKRLMNASFRKFHQALELSQKIPNPYEQICALTHLGKWYLTCSDREKGLLLLIRAYELAKKHNTSAKLVEITLELANSYKQNHSFQLASEFFEKYIFEKESLSINAYASQLRHLETAQKIEIVNRRNHQLRKEIQEKIQAQAKLEVLATTDPLTGLFNRRHFFTLTEHWCENALAIPFDVSSMMVDIDHFKNINDQYGHPAGDQVLVQVAQTIQNALRTDDVLCRYGGEEFCILLPNTNLVAAQQVGERIRQRIEKAEIRYESQIIHLTVSIGIADLANSPKHSVMGLLGHADQALYTAKHKGRNCCAIFSAK